MDDLATIRRGSVGEGFRLIGHSDLCGYGDGLQVLKQGSYVYVAHMGTSPVALSIVDVSDPSRPQVVRQLERPPHTRCCKIQISGDILIQNEERQGRLPPGATHLAGIRIFDISEPTKPREIGRLAVPGRGVHRMWYVPGSPYAHIATSQAGFRGRIYAIVDLADPVRPEIVGQWWIPGQKEGERELWDRFPGETFHVHGVIAHGNRAYVSCTDAGMAIVDIEDVAHPKTVSRVDWSPPFGGFTHTALPLPGRRLVVVANEAIEPHGADGDKRIWVVDVREERNPVTVGAVAHPEGDFRQYPTRFGPHNLHENRPGSFQSESLIFATYFNAGIRAYDIRDPFRPSEVAYFIPPAPPGQPTIECNDLYVDTDRLVYVTDRHTGGLYILEYTGPLWTA